MKMKAKTAIRLRPRLKRPVRTIESGITSRGNWVLRTIPSLPTIEVTAAAGRLLDQGEEDDVEQQHHRVVGHAAAQPEDLGEDQQQHPEQQQRPASDQK